MAAFAYLDIEDEITNAVARIRASDEANLALVLPPGSRIGTSRINFRLLEREGGALGRRIAIVTVEPGVRAIAVSAGLPAYASVAEYEASLEVGTSPPVAVASAAPLPPAPPPLAPPPAETDDAAGATLPIDLPVVRGVGARRIDWGGRRRLWIGLVALLSMAFVVAGVGAFLVLPSATITVAPRVESVGPVALTIVADPAVSDPDPAAGVIPASTVKVPLEASKTFAATGVQVVETRATGTVTFTNNDTGKPVSIAAGSVVATDSDVRFRTLATITVPRAKFKPTFEPGRASVRVEALTAGTSGNVAANAIGNVPSGTDPSLLDVTNAAPTGGGTHTETKIVLKADVDAALKSLTDEIAAGLAAALADPATGPEGLTLFVDTAVMGEAVPEPAPATLVGRKVASFGLALAATATVTAVDESLLEPLATKAIRAAVPAGRQLFPASVRTTIGEGTVEGATVTFRLGATASAWQPLDATALLAEVQGLSVVAARDVLLAYGEVTIDTWPGYVDTIPTLEGRATLTVVEPTASPAP